MARTRSQSYKQNCNTLLVLIDDVLEVCWPTMNSCIFFTNHRWKSWFFAFQSLPQWYQKLSVSLFPIQQVFLSFLMISTFLNRFLLRVSICFHNVLNEQLCIIFPFRLIIHIFHVLYFPLSYHRVFTFSTWTAALTCKWIRHFIIE